MRTDPVTLKVLENHAQAVAESMAFTLFRTAHSTFVKETEDFTTGLVTPSPARPILARHGSSVLITKARWR